MIAATISRLTLQRFRIRFRGCLRSVTHGCNLGEHECEQDTQQKYEINLSQHQTQAGGK